MSQEGAGARIVREGKEKGLSINDIRMQLSAIYPASVWKGRQTGNFLPWEQSKRNQFEDLLQKNREENLLTRMIYYKEQDLLRSGDQYLMTIVDGGHTVYVNRSGPFPIAYTIGLNYIHDLPELLIAYTDGPQDTAVYYDMGNLLNAAARNIIANKNSIQENTPATQVFKRFQQDAKFTKITPKQRTEYMNTCSWFYRNFMDTEEYPVLALFVEVSQEDTNKEQIVSSLYEKDENMSFFAHAKVDKIPTLEAPDASMTMMAELVKTRWVVNPKKFEELKDFKITEKGKYCQAAGACSVEDLKKIIEESPFDIKRISVEEETAPLQYAIMSEKFENAKYLISLGVNLAGNGEERSMLMDAVQYGIEEGVHLLVEAGAPLEDTDEENWTALSIASKAILHKDMKKAQRILEYLWEKGARMM